MDEPQNQFQPNTQEPANTPQSNISNIKQPAPIASNVAPDTKPEAAPAKTGIKKVWIIIIAVVLTGGVAGGGTYAYFNSKATKEKADMQAKIDEANGTIATLNGTIANTNKNSNTGSVAVTNSNANVNANTNSAAVDPTAGWKTFSDDTYKINFKYPTAWSTLNIKSPDLAKKVTEFSPSGNTTDTDLPSVLSLYVYEKTADLDTQKLGATSLKNYLDKYSTLSDPLITNVKSIKIGSLSGYQADAGPNTFGGGTYYYLENNKTVFVWIFSARGGGATSTDKQKVLDSVKIQ